MNSISQYTELLKAHGEAIVSHSAECLRAVDRAAASACAEKCGLPGKGDEDYEITDLCGMFAPDYGVNVLRRVGEVDLSASFRCDVPNLSTRQYVAQNDVYGSVRAASPMAEPDGVQVVPFTKVEGELLNVVKKTFGTIAPVATSGAVALNTMLVQDGLLVYVPAGVKSKKPIQLVNVLSARSALLATRRVLVVLEEGAEATLLLCDHTQTPDVEFLSNQVVEVLAGKNSHFELYDLEESGTGTHRNSGVYVKQESGSDVLVCGITLKNGVSRNDFVVNVDGSDCQTRLYGVAIGCGTQQIDNHTLVNHNVGNCSSNQLFKYALDGDAKGAFSGKIMVAHGASGVEAYQNNKNVVASETAKMHTKPQLEIYTDDVKCSHGTAIGRLDDEALQYMRTRGIGEAEARTMLMQAFMTDIIESVRLESLRDRLRYLVEKTFDGTLSKCSTCSAKCRPLTEKNK